MVPEKWKILSSSLRCEFTQENGDKFFGKEKGINCEQVVSSGEFDGKIEARNSSLKIVTVP